MVRWLLKVSWRELFTCERVRRDLNGRRCFWVEHWLGHEDSCTNWSRSHGSSIPGTEANRWDTTECSVLKCKNPGKIIKKEQNGNKCLTDLPVLSTGMELGLLKRFYWCHFQLIVLSLAHIKEETALPHVSSTCCLPNSLQNCLAPF